MAGSVNRVMLLGRLTADPEMKYLANGSPLTTMRMVTNRYATGPDGERREFADFHQLVVWNVGPRKLAELAAQYLRKGSLVYVEGRLQTRSWQDQTGQKRWATDVNVNDIQFVEPNADGAGHAPSTAAAPVPAAVGSNGRAPRSAAAGWDDVDGR